MSSDQDINMPNIKSGLNQAEVDQIIERIAENLDFRQLTYEEVDDHFEVRPPIPELSSLERFEGLLHEVSMSAAPLRPSIVGGIRGLIYRVLNLPIRIFAAEQIVFNRQLRELIGELAEFATSLRDQSRAMRLAIETLPKITKRVQEQEELWSQLGELSSIRSRLDSYDERPESATRQHAEYEEFLHSNESDRQSILEQVGRLENRLSATEEWIRLVAAEMRDVALETRALADLANSTKKETRLVSPARLGKKISESGDDLKINVGSGHRPMEGYINVDLRELPEERRRQPSVRPWITN